MNGKECNAGYSTGCGEAQCGRPCREMYRTIRVLDRNIRIRIYDTGAGITVLIEGGDRGHIGAVAVAKPHEEPQVITFLGHREDVICRQWAGALADACTCPVVTVAGVHYDTVGPAEIRMIVEALEKELDEVISVLKSSVNRSDFPERG